MCMIMRFTAHPSEAEIREALGLTWQDKCSREAHWQSYRGFFGREPEPGAFSEDPPSVTRPPPGWVPPPLPAYPPVAYGWPAH